MGGKEGHLCQPQIGDRTPRVPSLSSQGPRGPQKDPEGTQNPSCTAFGCLVHSLQGPARSPAREAPGAAADSGPECGVKRRSWALESDSLIPFPSQPVLPLGVTSPQPPQRPGQGLVERQMGSGVTVCGQVRGQRFADSRLRGIDSMGEVTEFYQGLWAQAGVSELDTTEPRAGPSG